MFEKIVNEIRSHFPNQDFVPLHEPRFRGNEKEYVNDAIDSTFVSSVGRYVDKFEQMICDYTGAGYAVATVNGTSALHMGLIMAGVSDDDIVITQPLSFIATCNAISYLKADPLFVDIDSKTLGLSAESLTDFFVNFTFIKSGTCFHRASGRRIAACVPMHTFGHPAEIDTIAEICEQYKVPLVEDCAESIGSLYKGKHTGVFGQTGAFSFNGNKTITCGGGGVLVTNDSKLAKLAKHLTTQAKVPHSWHFSHDHIGYNYRLPNLNAALACAQLEQLPDFISRKRELAKRYRVFFNNNKIDFITEPSESRSNYWLNAILFESKIVRDQFLEYSNGNKVMTRPVWDLINDQAMFSHCITHSDTQARIIADKLVNIPSSVN